MTVIVKGHGTRPDDQETFVPTGVKLRFYSDFDVNLGSTVALIAIADGATAEANETVNGTGEVGDVANYAVWTQDDQFYAMWLATGEQAKLPIYWVGNDIPNGTRLCNAPDKCTGGTHTCEGVLGKLKGVDTDIVILACRGVRGGAGGSESKYGKDENDPLRDLGKETRDFIKEILQLAVRDPRAAEAEADGLPQGTIATMVSASYDWRDWQAARALKDLCLAGDWEQIMGHLRVYAGRIDDVLKWTDKVPGYGQALDSAVVSQMVSFADEYQKSPNDRIFGALAKRPAVQVALKALRSDVWQPDQAAVDAITTLNGSNVKATDDKGSGRVLTGGILVLVGDGHNADAIAYVSRQSDFENGRFTVTKGGAFGKGGLEVTGIQKKQELVTRALAEFSDKTVTFA